MFALIRQTLWVATLVLGATSTAAQQDLFKAAILVNGAAVTNYELQQRARMLVLLNAPGNPDVVAREQLIDDRLRIQAARAQGIQPSPQEVLDGMEEFASRANLSREQFIQILNANGVAEESFRDFVSAGIAWREVVRLRFGPRSAVSEAEVDRALSAGGGGSSIRVLLSEIILPVTPRTQAQQTSRANDISQISSVSAFSAQAGRFSASASRRNGGRLPWRDLNELPPPLRPIILGLKPGEVTEPLNLSGALLLFQLRDIEETAYSELEPAAIEYAAFYMPGGRSQETLAQARVLKSKVDRCDDLYGVARGLPEDRLERGALPPSEIPTDIAFELSKLDPGEVSTALTRANGQTLVFLMLCGRAPKLSDEVDRDEFVRGLRNQRVSSLAASYLSQLRSEARIINR